MGRAKGTALRRSLIGSLLVAAVLLAGCGGTPTPAARKFKVGLVTDVGQPTGYKQNAAAFRGMQKAGQELGVSVEVIVSAQAMDYQKNMQSFVTRGFDLVVTAGALMGEDTLTVARQNPSVKFAIVDVQYFPDRKIQNDAEPYSTYARNVTSLVFREDQAGFLVGAVAGGMTRSNVVGGVYGPPGSAVCRIRSGYERGARWANPNARTLGVYQPSSSLKALNDPDWGKARGLEQIGQGADVLFGAGGLTGNGALLAARERATAARPIYAIGADQDPYDSVPEVRPVLMTSALKKVDVAVFTAVKTLVAGQLRAGPMTFDVGNDGVAAAPFHDLEGKVTQAARDRLAQAKKALQDKTVDTGYPADQCK